MAKANRQNETTVSQAGLSRTDPVHRAAMAPLAVSSFGKAIRETVEAVVVAFILAFLFRTFEAEAFVIPTGSMAPTLMGQHKDLRLSPSAAIPLSAGASSEAEDVQQQRAGAAAHRDRGDLSAVPLSRVGRSRHRRRARQHPTYGGDRILVSKTL